jgi:hypothetical protein
MPQYLLSVWHDEPYDDLDRWIVQAPDLDAALDWAAKAAAACEGPVEVRPTEDA